MKTCDQFLCHFLLACTTQRCGNNRCGQLGLPRADHEQCNHFKEVGLLGSVLLEALNGAIGMVLLMEKCTCFF